MFLLSFGVWFSWHVSSALHQGHERCGWSVPVPAVAYYYFEILQRQCALPGSQPSALTTHLQRMIGKALCITVLGDEIVMNTSLVPSRVYIYVQTFDFNQKLIRCKEWCSYSSFLDNSRHYHLLKVCLLFLSIFKIHDFQVVILSFSEKQITTIEYAFLYLKVRIGDKGVMLFCMLCWLNVILLQSVTT